MGEYEEYEEQIKEHLRRGIEWIQLDAGQDPKAFVTHHGIHSGPWELDGFRFSMSLGMGLGTDVFRKPVLITGSKMDYMMPAEVWSQIKIMVDAIGVQIVSEWTHDGMAYSGALSVDFGRAFLEMHRRYGRQICETCPTRERKIPSSTFCNCGFIAKRHGCVVLPAGWRH